MGDFKDGKTLLEEQRAQGKLGVYERPIPEAGKSKLRQIEPRRPKDYIGEVCENWVPGGCKAMLEAIKLGLTEPTFICTGVVATTCGVRSRLAAGVTVMELFNK